MQELNRILLRSCSKTNSPERANLKKTANHFNISCSSIRVLVETAITN